MKIYLKKNEERRLKAGHQWVFSNEIGKTEGEVINGGIAELYSSNESFLGKGFYNKNSLITYRQITVHNVDIDRDFLRKRIKSASEFRLKYLKDRDAYRFVNSESDFLPGLIIDKFNNSFSIQIYSFGMENYITDIVEILKEDYDAELIIARNTGSTRKLENLELYDKTLFAKNDNNPINNIVSLSNIKYNIDIEKGQKTGYYLDQIENQDRLRQYVKSDSSVLDLFCSEGGFALNAAVCNPADVTGIDSSSEAITAAIENAKLNNLKVNFLCEDVFKYLDNAGKNKQKFDIIIVDPPSFAKSKKNLNPAIYGYVELNSNAMKLLKPDSIMFTFSCSHHVTEDIFSNIISKSSTLSKRRVQILEKLGAGIDHPVLPQMEETKYLKGFILRVL